jgi:hypothetical protein
MTWQTQLKEGNVQPHIATRREIEDLRSVVQRNLADASLQRLSADNRLGLAYEAALVACKMVIHASGYRVRSGIGGAHSTTLECALIALGRSSAARLQFFDSIRRRRNTLSYDVAGTVSDHDAGDALRQATTFVATVEVWLKRHAPGLA